MAELTAPTIEQAALAAASMTKSGRKHKSGAERFIVTARARLSSLLDQDGAAGSCRAELEAVADLLAKAELEMAQMRHRGQISGHWKQLMDFAREGKKSITDEWLLQSFTDEINKDNVAAGHQLAMASQALLKQEVPTASRELSMMRMVSVNYLSDIHAALADDEVGEVLDQLGSFNFDALAWTSLSQVGSKPIQIFGAHITEGVITCIAEEGFVPDREMFQARVIKFFHELDKAYRADAIYHGRAHAVDVAATVHWFMQKDYFRERMSSLDIFLGLTAALIHDVAHPGVNAAFLTKTMDPLAVRYNDRSILENMHVSRSFEIMQQDQEVNWFELLPKERECTQTGNKVNLQQFMRRGLISTVLATDMTLHAKHVAKLQEMVDDDADEAPTKVDQLDQKLLLLETIVHASDISNPCKSRLIMLAWTKRVLEECWLQGDEERRLGLEVSPLCDRGTGQSSVPRGQLGFINFVIQPFYATIVQIVPGAKESTEQLVDNKAFWEEQAKAEAMPEQLFVDCR